MRAAHTLALLALKPGLFTAHGRDHAGRVWFDDLGVTATASAIELAGCDAALALSAPRLHAQHKGSFGDVVVIGGASGMVGAAVLAAGPRWRPVPGASIWACWPRSTRPGSNPRIPS